MPEQPPADVLHEVLYGGPQVQVAGSEAASASHSDAADGGDQAPSSLPVRGA